MQPRNAELHLWRHNASNHKEDGLQQQKNKHDAAPVILEPESEATFGTDSPNLDNRRLENFACSVDDQANVDLMLIWSDHSEVGLDFGVNDIKTWIHPAFYQHFRQQLVVSI